MDQLRKFKSLNHSNNVAIPPNNSPLDGKNGNNNNNVNNNNNPLNTLLAERMKNEFPAIFQHISKLKQIVEQSISNEAKKTQAIDLVSTISSFIEENICHSPKSRLIAEDKKDTLKRFKSGLNLRSFKVKSTTSATPFTTDDSTYKQRRSTLSEIQLAGMNKKSLPKIGANRDSNYLLSDFLLNSTKPPSVLNMLNMEVHPQKKHDLLAMVCGPDRQEREERYGNFASGQSISTYPTFKNKRTGDPICDRFYVQLYKTYTIISLADGCNWGSKPREAAVLACNEVVSYMAKKMQEKALKNTKNIAQELLKAFMAAHQKILHTKSEFKDPGATTLLCAITVKLKNTLPVDNPKWLCICSTLGDCKAFYYSAKEKNFHEITSGSRLNIQDITDCGGKLGSWDEGKADLRNLMVFSLLLEEGDIVFACSDGLHDNLDPEQQGITPSELNIHFDTWKEAEQNAPDLVHSCKSKFRLSLIKKIVIGEENNNNNNNNNNNDNIQPVVVSPHLITSSLVKFCHDLTSATRSFMENNPESRQPKDMKEYPGKLDHTTCVSVLISRVTKHPFPDLNSIKSSKRAKKKFKEFVNDPSIDVTTLRLGNLIPTEKIRSVLQTDEKFYFQYQALLKSPSLSRIISLISLLPTSDDLIEDHKLYISKANLDQFYSSIFAAFELPLKEIVNRLECIFKYFQNSSWMKYECFSEKCKNI